MMRCETGDEYIEASRYRGIEATSIVLQPVEVGSSGARGWRATIIESVKHNAFSCGC